MSCWYTNKIKMSQEEIEEVIDTYGRKGDTLPKNVNLDRVRYIIERYLTVDDKPTQREIAAMFDITHETTRQHILRIARACQQVLEKRRK